MEEMEWRFLLPLTCLYVREGHAYHKVAGPVAAAGKGNGSGPRPLAEQFSHYEPRNGARTNLEETHKEENGRHAGIAHPGVLGLGEECNKQESQFVRNLSHLHLGALFSNVGAGQGELDLRGTCIH